MFHKFTHDVYATGGSEIWIDSILEMTLGFRVFLIQRAFPGKASQLGC